VIGEVFSDEGDFTTAQDHLTLCLEGYRELQNPFGVAGCLRRMGWLAAARGDSQQAARLLGAAEALGEDVGASLPVHDRERMTEVTESLRAAAGPGLIGEWWASGAVMSMDDAIEYALEG
jgi:hypothetical protein